MVRIELTDRNLIDLCAATQLALGAHALAAPDNFMGRKRKSVGWTHAGALATIAGLKLWRGFKRNNSRVKAEI
eukprot:XP_001697368.1 predicted protein [Chlamydomonas reinhardtii]